MNEIYLCLEQTIFTDADKQWLCSISLRGESICNSMSNQIQGRGGVEPDEYKQFVFCNLACQDKTY